MNDGIGAAGVWEDGCWAEDGGGGGVGELMLVVSAGVACGFDVEDDEVLGGVGIPGVEMVVDVIVSVSLSFSLCSCWCFLPALGRLWWLWCVLLLFERPHGGLSDQIGVIVGEYVVDRWVIESR